MQPWLLIVFQLSYGRHVCLIKTFPYNYNSRLMIKRDKKNPSKIFYCQDQKCFVGYIISLLGGKKIHWKIIFSSRNYKSIQKILDEKKLNNIYNSSFCVSDSGKLSYARREVELVTVPAIFFFHCLRNEEKEKTSASIDKMALLSTNKITLVCLNCLFIKEM